jgi:hypothetical protein
MSKFACPALSFSMIRCAILKSKKENIFVRMAHETTTVTSKKRKTIFESIEF